MTDQLGDLDRRIVAALQLQPRAAWSQVARLTGTTETTAARRATRLVAQGVLRFAAVADPIRCGFGQPVLLQLKCEPGTPAQVATALAAREDVRFCTLTTGAFDVVAELISPSRENLARVLVGELGALQGITATSTSLVTRNYKTSHDWSRRLLSAHHSLGDHKYRRSVDAGKQANPDSTDARGGEGGHDGAANHAVDLDGIDLQLVAALADNCRRAYADLAGEIGISESAVRRRVDRLVAERCLLFSAYVDPACIGYELEFLTWLRLPYQHLNEVATLLAGCREVRYLSATAGSAQLVCEVVLPHMADLYTFTTEVLARVPEPNAADIGVEIGAYKRAWQAPAQPGGVGSATAVAPSRPIDDRS